VVVVFLVDLWAIGWRSLWTAVAARQANQAAASALAPVLLLPWALLFGVVMVLARLGRFDLEAGVWVGIWFGFSLATDIGCFLLARDRLENRFREVATHRFLGPKRGILGWLFPPR
jgi:hypothetical protein